MKTVPTVQSSLASVALCGLAMMAGLGCEREPTNNTSTKNEQANASVEKIAEQPDRFIGKNVVVSGEIDHVYGDRAFELEDRSDVIFEDHVLVLSKSPIRLGGAALSDDQVVIVSGKVRRMQVADVERDLGWDLSPDIEQKYGSKPVLVADSIDQVSRSARWSEQDQNGELIGIWSVYAVVEPAAMAGQKIRLESVPVSSVASKAFWVGYGHTDQLLVAPPAGAQLPKVGDRVDVRGSLTKMPPAQAAIQQFGLNPSLSKQVEQESLYVDAKQVSKGKTTSHDQAQASKAD